MILVVTCSACVGAGCVAATSRGTAELLAVADQG
jgi:hypothetical protein